MHAVLATLRHVVRDLHSSRVPHRQLPPRHVHQDPQEGASQRRQEEVPVMFQIVGHMSRFTLFVQHLYWTCASSFAVVTFRVLVQLPPESVKNENIVVPYTIVKRNHVVLHFRM